MIGVVERNYRGRRSDMNSQSTVYIEVFAVDLISLFSRVHAPTNSSSIRGDQHVAILYTWKPLIILSVVCASMMIGHVTAVYYMYVCASWIRTLVKLHAKPRENSFSGFWSQSVKYCPCENFNVHAYGFVNRSRNAL